jgi:LPS sulfotransferase NodH
MNMAGPWLSYLICSTPRSGSTLLCEGVRGAGLTEPVGQRYLSYDQRLDSILIER